MGNEFKVGEYVKVAPGNTIPACFLKGQGRIFIITKNEHDTAGYDYIIQSVKHPDAYKFRVKPTEIMVVNPRVDEFYEEIISG